MTFRTKLLIAFAATVIVAVGAVTLVVGATTRGAFERLDDQRTAALVAQFRREFARRGDEVSRRVARIAESDALKRIAIELNRPEPDYSIYVDEAPKLAPALNLDFLELVAPDGSIISSAQWPARFGYKDEWVVKSGTETAALKREELPDETVLALVAVRAVAAGDQKMFVAGGEKLDKDFLASLTMPESMRVLLYRNFEPKFTAAALTSAAGAPANSQRFAPLIEQVRRQGREAAKVLNDESFQAIPLFGREGGLLGVLLVGSSRRDQVALERLIFQVGGGVGAGGILLGVLIAWWATAHVTRPVRQLADAAGAVAAGDWNTHVDVTSGDEIGELARAFNQMTQQLIEQRERLVQSERVAAWRELARRLAHELKNPLFPLQITVENMRRAKEQYPEQFDEVFHESAETLLAELANLKAIVASFSDFARMPPPHRQTVQVNEVVRAVLKLFHAQLGEQGVAAEVSLDASLPEIQADPEQLSRALRNLVLNAMDAMQPGGRLSVRTSRNGHGVHLEVADTGAGLTKEECERLFTPYYTTKQHGTGLGLAIVQSVISDHGGRIAVDSEVGRGTTFRIELPHGESSHS